MLIQMSKDILTMIFKKIMKNNQLLILEVVTVFFTILSQIMINHKMCSCVCFQSYRTYRYNLAKRDDEREPSYSKRLHSKYEVCFTKGLKLFLILI